MTGTEDVRLAVYRELAMTGSSPTVSELAVSFGAAEIDIRADLRALHAARHIVLDTDDRILMAHRPSHRGRTRSAPR
jgi:hypothetical protein